MHLLLLKILELCSLLSGDSQWNCIRNILAKQKQVTTLLNIAEAKAVAA